MNLLAVFSRVILVTVDYILGLIHSGYFW